MSVIRMEQLGPHWTDFREVLLLGFLLKRVDLIQVCLKSGGGGGE